VKVNELFSIDSISTITSKKEKEHNNLATIQGTKLMGTHECSKNFHFLKPTTQMQALTRMDKVVIKDYYHMSLIG
jgi:hypothetical protein